MPYRDSKLTLLLRDSLGGDARTWVIANVASDPRYLAETISTLKFAARARLGLWLGLGLGSGLGLRLV